MISKAHGGCAQARCVYVELNTLVNATHLTQTDSTYASPKHAIHTRAHARVTTAQQSSQSRPLKDKWEPEDETDAGLADPKIKVRHQT